MKYAVGSIRRFSASTLAMAAALAAMTAAGSAFSADGASEPAAEPSTVAKDTNEWPCVSRKVLSLDAATIWDGPDISAETEKKWRSDEKVRKLSQYLISRRVPLEEAEAAVKTFAKEQADDQRDARLTELFAAVLSRTNDERKLVLSGIERFHKRQVARAKEIEREGLALPGQGEALPTDAMPAGEIDKISNEQELYNWNVRVFQERQKNIPIACEIPQLMDERAGAIARSIRGEMKS